MGGPGSLFSYGSAWANLSNTPLWLYKHYAHEGGIRTPMIVHWPAKTGKGGGLRAEIVHTMDIMATCVDVAGAAYPETYDGREILPMEGRSLVPAIEGGKPEAAARTLVFEHERNAALLEGDWKLVGQRVIARQGLAKDGRWQLFNVAADPSEQHDLGATHPERLARMIKTLEAEATRTLVLPAP
jgi:arylsulfatase